MKNFQLGAASVSGDDVEIYFETGRNVVDWLAGMDIDPEVSFVSIKVYDDTGQQITIRIPNDDSDTVTVQYEPVIPSYRIAAVG